MEIFCPPGCLSGSLGQDSTMPRICSGPRKDNRARTTYWKTYSWILRSCRHPDHSAIALYHTTERFGASGVLSLNFWASASIFSSSGKGDHFWPAEGARQRGCSGLEKVKAIRWLLSCQKKNNQHHHHHHRDYHHHHQGWRLCWRPCGRLHPQLPRGDHCHGGDCISRWIMKIIAAKIIVGILLIFRSRVEFNFAGLWGLWRSRPLLADWTKSKRGWRWYYMLMATLIFWGKKLKEKKLFTTFKVSI